MKELINSMDNLPMLVKIILAIPALDIVWCIYRICRGVDINNILSIVVGIVLVFIPVTWVFDIIMILTKGSVWCLE